MTTSDEPGEWETLHLIRKQVSIFHLSRADTGIIPLADQKPNGSLMSGHLNHEWTAGTSFPKNGAGLPYPASFF